MKRIIEAKPVTHSEHFHEDAHTTKWIPVKDLSIVWATAQREFNVRHAKKISDTFDPDLFDDLVVTLPNGDGVYHVVDGQHRKAAIQELYGEDERVPCRIVNVTDPARAAEIFDRINTSRKAPSSIEKFKVRVTAGYEDEVAINKLINSFGYRVAHQTAANTIRAVGSLQYVHKSYGLEVLKETLMTIKGTWDADGHALDGPIIQGYGALIAEHRKHLDWKRMREQISIKFTPGRLLGHAKTEREIRGGSMGDAVRSVLIRTYNQGIKIAEKKLEE